LDLEAVYGSGDGVEVGGEGGGFVLEEGGGMFGAADGLADEACA